MSISWWQISSPFDLCSRTQNQSGQHWWIMLQRGRHVSCWSSQSDHPCIQHTTPSALKDPRRTASLSVLTKIASRIYQTTIKDVLNPFRPFPLTIPSPKYCQKERIIYLYSWIVSAFQTNSKRCVLDGMRYRNWASSQSSLRWVGKQLRRCWRKRQHRNKQNVGTEWKYQQNGVIRLATLAH